MAGTLPVLSALDIDLDGVGRPSVIRLKKKRILVERSAQIPMYMRMMIVIEYGE